MVDHNTIFYIPTNVYFQSEVLKHVKKVTIEKYSYSEITAEEILHDENLINNLYNHFPNALIEVKMRQKYRNMEFGYFKWITFSSELDKIIKENK